LNENKFDVKSFSIGLEKLVVELGEKFLAKL